MKLKFDKIGFYVALYATVLILIWIGLFKFTLTEAKAIQPLIVGSPFFSWMNSVLTVQQVSNFMGCFEIVTALLLASFPFCKKTALIGGALNTIIFLGTISFLVTNSGMFKLVDGFPTTDFFILKDFAFLGIGLMVFGKSLSALRSK